MAIKLLLYTMHAVHVKYYMTSLAYHRDKQILGASVSCLPEGELIARVAIVYPCRCSDRLVRVEALATGSSSSARSRCPTSGDDLHTDRVERSLRIGTRGHVCAREDVAVPRGGRPCEEGQRSRA